MTDKNWTDEEQIFAETFHTALRKALDSTASSICWNAIYVMDGNDWLNFCQYVTSHDGSLKDRCLSRDAVEWGNSGRSLFRIGLEMLEPEEYEAIDSWMGGLE